MKQTSIRILPMVSAAALVGASVTGLQAQQRLIDAPIPGTDGVLEAADCWGETPAILSAGL